MTVFSLLALIGPLLLLATTVVGLWSYGPLGWLASVLLVAGIAGGCRWAVRVTLRWWRSTKAPEQPQVRPSDRRRAQARPTPVQPPPVEPTSSRVRPPGG